MYYINSEVIILLNDNIRLTRMKDASFYKNKYSLSTNMYNIILLVNKII